MAKAKEKEEITYKLGWLPDLPDARDFMYAAPLKVMQKLKPSVDLRKKCPVVYDQAHLNSCTANALGAAFQVGQKIQQLPTWMPSRLFIYYNERVVMHSENSDSGAFLRDGIKTMSKKGVCTEKEWAYNDSDQPGAKFSQKPPKECYTHALKNKITSYMRLQNNLNTLKGCLAEGFPFVFGFTVYDSFMSSKMRRTGIMPMPDFNNEGTRGGHAVMAVGYDDAKEALLVRNSWGPGWGIEGYFWMPYAYVSNNNLCDDFWTIRLVKSEPVKKARKNAKRK